MKMLIIRFGAIELPFTVQLMGAAEGALRATEVTCMRRSLSQKFTRAFSNVVNSLFTLVFTFIYFSTLVNVRWSGLKVLTEFLFSSTGFKSFKCDPKIKKKNIIYKKKCEIKYRIYIE